MGERLPSDHEDVETHRVRLSRVGRTDRPQVELPEDLDLAADDVVRVALDGRTHHGRVDATLEGTPVLRRIADNRRLAREDAGENRLGEWVADADVTVGGTVHLDVITRGHEYGLRTPGDRVVYTATASPDDGLADIARDLDG